MMIRWLSHAQLLTNSQSSNCSAIFSPSETEMDFLGNEFQEEVDPAAEFLAREQSELEELGIEDQLGVPSVKQA